MSFSLFFFFFFTHAPSCYSSSRVTLMNAKISKWVFHRVEETAKTTLFWGCFRCLLSVHLIFHLDDDAPGMCLRYQVSLTCFFFTDNQPSPISPVPVRIISGLQRHKAVGKGETRSPSCHLLLTIEWIIVVDL